MPKKASPRMHFAIGLVVNVRAKAKPAGWPEYEKFDEALPTNRSITAVAEDGTCEVSGWYWWPTDLVVA